MKSDVLWIFWVLTRTDQYIHNSLSIHLSFILLYSSPDRRFVQLKNMGRKDIRSKAEKSIWFGCAFCWFCLFVREDRKRCKIKSYKARDQDVCAWPNSWNENYALLNCFWKDPSKAIPNWFVVCLESTRKRERRLSNWLTRRSLRKSWSNSEKRKRKKQRRIQ